MDVVETYEQMNITLYEEDHECPKYSLNRSEGTSCFY